MSGGGGGAVPQAGLTPLQRSQFGVGQDMVSTNQPKVDWAAGHLLKAEDSVDRFLSMQNGLLDRMSKMQDRQADLNQSRAGWDQSQANWARGGLLRQGLHQLSTGLQQSPDQAAMQARSMGRLGLEMSPEQAQRLQEEQALGKTSSTVGLSNATRLGLSNAQRDMRFGGL